MKHVVMLCTALAVASPAFAQDEEAEPRNLMSEGAQLFFEGLQNEMSPALQGLQLFAEQTGESFTSFLSEMGPAFSDLMKEVKDWSAYEAPEVLPNGDIIIRKKPAEAEDQDGTAEEDASEGNATTGTTDL